MINYEDRGVSPHKPDVKNAIIGIDQGIFPNAFCKAIPDILCGSKDHCLLLHADGAGTKSSLAYIYYKENEDLNVFEGIAQDSLVMNLDDLLCVGAVDTFILSNTIGRNYKLINGEILKKIIFGYTKMIKLLEPYGIQIYNCGGETADIGDLTRTIIVDSVLATRILKKNFIDCSKVKANHDIIGLASFGKAVYEEEYNSGIGSNGLTAARHEILSSKYKEKYPESFAPEISNFCYTGKFNLNDKLPNTNLTIGKAILSPTRTYAPVIKEVLNKYKNSISAVFHNTGGGQTKCLNFGNNIKYIKNNLFPIPPIFKLIKENTSLSQYEMHRVFNMGHRMEIVCDPKVSLEIIKISEKYEVEARIVGKTELANNSSLTIITPDEVLEYIK
ncbi:MAG: AIR synthase-related protein [bacterium]|nr:AIR synthase-related protein [bacterium]